MANNKVVQLKKKTVVLLSLVKSKLLKMHPESSQVSDDDTISAALDSFIKND